MIVPSNTDLRAFVEGHEGDEVKEYPDTKKIPTVGIGYNMTQITAQRDFGFIGANYAAVLAGSAQLTQPQVQRLFTLSLARAISNARTVFGAAFDSFPTMAKYVIVDMLFTMGYDTFIVFKLFIAAIKKKNYEEAAKQIENSLWYIEAPNRAKQDASVLRGCIVPNVA
jgi:lysozyme